MNADKILPILCRYLKDTDNRLLASYYSTLVNLKNIFQALHKPQTCSTWPKKAHNDPKYHKIKK